LGIHPEAARGSSISDQVRAGRMALRVGPAKT
jgi:hypothetical protein